MYLIKQLLTTKKLVFNFIGIFKILILYIFFDFWSEISSYFSKFCNNDMPCLQFDILTMEPEKT